MALKEKLVEKVGRVQFVDWAPKFSTLMSKLCLERCG